MCFNTHSSGESFCENELYSLISKENPDIVYLSEYYNKRVRATTEELCHDYPHGNTVDSLSIVNGLVYYSKYPLIRQCAPFIVEKPTDSVLYACGTIDSTLCHFIFCHLASNNIVSKTSQIAPADSINSPLKLLSYLRNLTIQSKQRKEQAEHICDFLDKNTNCNSPIILLGDMNDIWGSRALSKFRRFKFKDAWWNGGIGYGATIQHPIPYRIDYILYSKALKLRTIRRIKSNGLSDHDALVATFDLL